MNVFWVEILSKTPNLALMSKLPALAQTWLETIPEERRLAAETLIHTIQKSLPKGYELSIQSNMLAWVVPLKRYPAGYHCSPNTPLPFLNLASQKNALTLYHMGVYADKSILTWFETEWPKHTSQKLDMGKSCIRFKKIDQIPYQLISELMQKMSPDAWIELYSKAFLK